MERERGGCGLAREIASRRAFFAEVAGRGRVVVSSIETGLGRGGEA